jgi:hypothetical protein
MGGRTGQRLVIDRRKVLERVMQGDWVTTREFAELMGRERRAPLYWEATEQAHSRPISRRGDKVWQPDMVEAMYRQYGPPDDLKAWYLSVAPSGRQVGGQVDG